MSRSDDRARGNPTALRRWLAGATLLILVLAGLLAVGVTAAVAAGPTVRMLKSGATTYVYQPSTLTITAGTTVTWTNPSDTLHSVTANGGAFDSGYVYPAQTFAHRFATPGTFAYHCTVHTGQVGQIIVRAASGGPGVTQPPTDSAGRDLAPSGRIPAAIALAIIGLAAAAIRLRLVRRRT